MATNDRMRLVSFPLRTICPPCNTSNDRSPSPSSSLARSLLSHTFARFLLFRPICAHCGFPFPQPIYQQEEIHMHSFVRPAAGVFSDGGGQQAQPE